MGVPLIQPQSDWTVPQWLEHLEHRAAEEIQLGLDRITIVAQSLDLKTLTPTVITVAGTNGKGSTVTALETIYRNAGYQVGAYTSPHLLKFNERIRVNGFPISDTELCAAFFEIEMARQNTFLTYFEMATLAALLHFKRCALDVIILEVGLGGRLDATNCIDADLSIITTIDFDHQEYLGNTLEAIAYEKAGILRSGKSFIYADEHPPLSILDVVQKLGVTPYFYNKNYLFQVNDQNWTFTSSSFVLELPIPAIHLKSASAAIMASIILNEALPVKREDLILAMKQIYVPARLELQKGDVSILYDVSHNSQSAKLLADTVNRMQWQGRIYAVFSALKDKDILQLILPLKDCVHRWFPAELNNKRAASHHLLQEKFRESQIVVDFCYNSPGAAFEAAYKQAEHGDLILVYGSFYTVSQVLTEKHYVVLNEEVE